MTNKKFQKSRVGSKLYYIASSPRVPDGRYFKTYKEAREWSASRMRKGESSAGVAGGLHTIPKGYHVEKNKLRKIS